MNVNTLQVRWAAVVRTPQSRATSKKPLSICGPSGSGKTTLCRALCDYSQTYIEDVTDSLHIKKLMAGSGDFDATANQRWFLDRMEGFIDAAHGGQITLDQDPAAIVFTYSKMFQEEGMMSSVQYELLFEELLRIESKLLRWNSPRVVLCLDAPAEILRSRVVQRMGEQLSPPLAWFARVRECFCDLWSRFPNAVTLSTVDLTPEEVLDRARQLLEGQSAVERQAS